MPLMTLGEYLGYTCGLGSSTALYHLGLTRKHAHAVWYGDECLTEPEMRLIHQVYCVPLENLAWFCHERNRDAIDLSD
jgi:hypothetical protein